MIRKSLTLVPVGPVTNRSPRARTRRRCRWRRAPPRRPRRAGEEGAGRAAGAVEAVACRRRGRRCRRGRPAPGWRRAHIRRLGPPRPAPVTVTVSSPPEMRAVPGGASSARRGMVAADLARLARAFAEQDAAVAEPLAPRPRPRRARRRRRRRCGIRPATCFGRLGQRRGEAVAVEDRLRVGDRGRIGDASGPEPMSSGASPTTSEMASVSSRAGAAARARRPPLIRETWRRTQLISLDRRAGAEQGRGQRLLVRQGQPVGRAGRPAPRRRRSAGRGRRSSGPCAVRQREQPFGGRDAGRVGNRMARVEQLDGRQRARRAVRRHRQPLDAAP